MSIVRGAPVPVVDAARLLSAEAGRPARWITVRAGQRQVALAVGAVLGIRSVALRSLTELPPVLGTERAEAIAALGALDADLLLVLEAARILPESVWATLPEGVGGE